MTCSQALRSAALCLAPLSLSLAVALVVAVVAARWVPLPARLTARPSERAVIGGHGVAASLSADHKWRLPVSLDDVDPDYVRALIHLEDRRFLRHPGVDPLALGRAALANLRRGGVAQGGSTLSMQLAGLLEPRPRTLGGKLVEMLRALQLELVLGKEGVLEAYLEFAPFGRNLEGVEAASVAYFGHGARALSPAEIGTLLAVAQAPSSRHPSPANRRRLKRARDAIVARLLEEGALAAEIDGAPFPWRSVIEHVRAEPVPRRLSLSRLAPPRAISRSPTDLIPVKVRKRGR